MMMMMINNNNNNNNNNNELRTWKTCRRANGVAIFHDCCLRYHSRPVQFLGIYS
jgi:hypothetical protein